MSVTPATQEAIGRSQSQAGPRQKQETLSKKITKIKKGLGAWLKR
jgi:hypothetical protein